MEHKPKVSSRFDGGFYLACAGHLARCTYQPTYGFEGFGAARRRVTYPAGAIRVPFDSVSQDFSDLAAAKDWFAEMVATDASEPQCNRGPFYREGTAPIIKVHGHAGLVAINTDSRLYVRPCGDGFSCYGFDVADRKGRAVADWAGVPFTDAPLGTVEHFDSFQAAMAAGAAKHSRTGERCGADLVPALIGLEGKRVEVTAPNGEKARFIVGKSTGWLPCHLEIARRNSIGGPAVYVPAGATIRVVG